VESEIVKDGITMRRTQRKDNAQQFIQKYKAVSAEDLLFGTIHTSSGEAALDKDEKHIYDWAIFDVKEDRMDGNSFPGVVLSQYQDVGTEPPPDVLGTCIQEYMDERGTLICRGCRTWANFWLLSSVYLTEAEDYATHIRARIPSPLSD
jgi:hypothetical protein